jgi:hypothetical protein
MIFNKDGNGISEFRHFCQWVYGSTDFRDLINDLLLAEREVAKVVGRAVFLRAERHYFSTNFTFSETMYTPTLAGYSSGSGSSSGSGDSVDINDQLVALVQRTVALYAYRQYSLNNDVSHGPTGRRVMIDNENEKVASEWMLEKDDDSTMRKVNDAFDALIEFLDENEIAEWVNSDIYRLTKELILSSTKEFNNVYPIDGSRRLYVAMIPFIKENQVKYIRPLITAYYDDLITSLRNNSNVNPVLVRIKELAQLPLALFTIATAVKRLSVKLLPDAIVQEYKSYITGRTGSFPVKQSEKEQYIKNITDDAVKELRLLENYIKAYEEALAASSGSGSDSDEEPEPTTIAERMDERNLFVRV